MPDIATLRQGPDNFSMVAGYEASEPGLRLTPTTFLGSECTQEREEGFPQNTVLHSRIRSPTI